MTPPQVAISARVSSDQHAVAHTMASQVAARRERRTTAGLILPAAMAFLAEG